MHFARILLWMSQNCSGTRGLSQLSAAIYSARAVVLALGAMRPCLRNPWVAAVRFLIYASAPGLCAGSIEPSRILITRMVAASVAVTFDVIPNPTTGASVKEIAVMQTFYDVIHLSRVGVPTTGPVSGVSSSSPPGPAVSDEAGDGDDATQAKWTLLLVLVVLAAVVTCALIACAIIVGSRHRSDPVKKDATQP